jgi:phage repressor protein C with HTH and peptisase S24 domain
MADKIGIKRSLLGAYEEGRADPRLNNLLKISEIYQFSVDTLIGEDLTVYSPEELDRISTAKNAKNQSLKVLSITVDNENRENIEMVPQKAAAGYLNGYADPEFLEELPKFQIPILPEAGTYRAFEIIGDSMLPVSSGSVIIGRYLESVSELVDGRIYILVTNREGVVFKRVYNNYKSNGKILLVSDNPTYAAYEIEPEDIIEIWESKAFFSLQFPTPNSGVEMTLEKLSSIVLDLQQELQLIKRRIGS